MTLARSSSHCGNAAESLTRNSPVQRSMTPASFTALFIALGLSLVLVVAGKLRFLEGTPRSIWLSGGGGVSVAYVFVHILPELAIAQEHFRATRETWLNWIELHSWLLALTGIVVFYGLERQIKLHQTRSGGAVPAGVFWIHTVSFAVYNVLFGYLLVHREETGLLSLATFGVAIAFHFIVNDYGLREDHKRDYDRTVRWILAAAVLSGWLVGVLLPVNRLTVFAIFAFLAGGIILNAMKEELPAERQSKFWAFAAGVVAYTAMLLAT